MDRRRLLGALAAAAAALALGAATKEPKRKDPPQPRASKRRKGVKSPDKHVDVAIVGAGAVGAWTAWHLVRQGLDVRLFDAYGAGNGRAASNLPTMLYDPAQGGDALYADLAHDSLPLWQRLSDSASLPIVTPCAAVTTLLPTDGADEPPGTDRTTGHKLRSRFGVIGWRDEEAALVAGKAALLAGRRAILETILDAQVDVEDVVMPAPLFDKKRDLHILPDGGTARSIVYATGAWLTELFPQILTPARLSAVRYQLFHVGPGQGDVQYRPPTMPALVDRAYGFTLLPDIEGRGVRVWKNAPDATVDPDSFDRRADDAALAAVRQWLAGRVPHLADAPVVASAAAHDCRTISGERKSRRPPNRCIGSPSASRTTSSETTSPLIGATRFAAAGPSMFGQRASGICE